MNTTSRTIAGIIMILLGGFLLIGSLSWKDWIVSLIYGLIIFILGWFIFFNKKEDEIEQIKEVKHKGGKKK